MQAQNQTGRSAVRNVFFPSEALAMPATSQRPAFNRRPLLCAAATMIVILAGAPDSYADDNDRGSSIQSWAVGHITHLPASTAQYNNQTIREIVHTSIGGKQARVRIANTFGSAPLVIGEAHVAVTSSGSSIVPGTDRALTFGDRRQPLSAFPTVCLVQHRFRNDPSFGASAL